MMGIGISDAAAALWKAYDPDSYEAAFIESYDGNSFFEELPDWAYESSEGPFFIDDDGAIWGVSTRPSQAGVLIGNLI